MSRVGNINISSVLYLDIQKQKKWYSILVFAKKTINNNIYLPPNINNSTLITNKMIVYYHKIMPIKAKIKKTINFLKKKN